MLNSSYRATGQLFQTNEEMSRTLDGWESCSLPRGDFNFGK